MIDYCIIGSGISGSTIANLLKKKYQVAIYDKARGPGGRSSFKRFDKKIGYDHGVQYISPKTVKFKKFINKLIKLRILKKWGGNHLFLNNKIKENKKHQKIIGTNGNNDISKYLIKDINCNFESELKKIKRKNLYWELEFVSNKKINCKNLILTCPHPQAKKLTIKYLKDKSILKNKIKMNANITVMFTLKKNIEKISSYFFDDPILGWAALENSKNRFKSRFNHWTLQSTSNWANKKINKNKKMKLINSNILINRFFELTNTKKEKLNNILNHGWKYSYNPKPLKIKSYWDKKIKLGICGDWFVGSRLESGWISANDLYDKIKKSN